MNAGGQGGLEPALARTEADASEAVAATRRLASAVRAAERAAQTGDLRALRRSIAGAEAAVGKVTQAVGTLGESWPFSEEQETERFASGTFNKELLDAAGGAGLALYEQDGVLASYPSLVRVQPRQQAVSIDRKLYRHIRPSHLVAHLGELQESEPRLNAERFAGLLYDAYNVIDKDKKPLVALLDIYAALTLLPSARAGYGRQEFARDVYLLDRSGHTATRAGVPFRLDPGSTAARDRRRILTVITRDGEERIYYGISFGEKSQA